jgi:predicted dehydrogenase
VYRDYRRLLDHADIDAVAIGTPDHWHPLITIHACMAGKDVYVEKPLAHTVAEGRLMVRAARRFNRVTQMGTQIHASENYRRCVEIVRSGMLGEITKTRVWIARNEHPVGLGRPADGKPPADVDYDMWLGPAPARPFNPLRFHSNWRYFWDYAGGTLGDMSCHTIDLIYWAMGLSAPRTVMASGGRYALQDIGETPDTMEAVWEFPPDDHRKSAMQMVWSLSEGNTHGINGKTMGIAFYGSEGTLIADYETNEVFDRRNRPVADRPPASIPPSPGHVREFLDAVKARTRCSCDVEYGWELTKVPVIANVAFRTGRKLIWDNVQEQFVNAPDANTGRSASSRNCTGMRGREGYTPVRRGRP